MKDEDSVDVISFIQGGQHLETGSSLDGIKQKLAELSNVKNLSFYLELEPVQTQYLVWLKCIKR